jgi:membrane associated rhomboid family serine protease
MFFFPYRVDFNVIRFPVMTLLTMVLCILIYWGQVHDQTLQESRRTAVCTALDTSGRMALAEFQAADRHCESTLLKLLEAKDPEKLIRDTADRAERNSSIKGWGETVSQTAHDVLASLRQQAAKPSLTERMLYHPESWSPWHAVTAALAHASLSHLLGNLFGFYVFAATVEAILGSLRFTLSMLLIAIGSHFCYSLANLGIAAPPTLGLSGVVMGMIGFFAWALPDARLRVAYWFLIRFGVTTMPAWFIALWYVGFDAYHLYTHAGGHVNLVAHVSGATIGAALAMTLFRRPVAEARQVALTP